MRVLSRLFRCLFLEKLSAAYQAGKLQFFTAHQALAGPEAVLTYLSRYTHRVAIANSRLIAFDAHGVTFRWKDYRTKGRVRYKTMTLEPAEFIRRFLLHVLPPGLHRIRHYGLLANTTRKDNLPGLVNC